MDLEACYTLFDALQLIKNTSMCVICLEMVQDPVFTRCQHMFCRVCIARILNSSTKVAHCPLCNTLLTKRNLVKNEHISKQIECAHRLIDSITEDLPMELSCFERPPHSTKESFTPMPYSGNTGVCNTTINNSTNIEFDKNKLDYSTDDLVDANSSEIMSCDFNEDKTNFPDKLTATKMTTLCPTSTPRFGKSYVRKPNLNSVGKLPVESDKSSSLSVDAESVRTLDLNLPTVNKSNSIANWLSSQTNSVCQVEQNKIDNLNEKLYPRENISDSTSLNSVKTAKINENNNLSSSLTKNKCISTLKHFKKDKSNLTMKLKEEPNKRDLETIYESLLQKRTVPKGIFDAESKNDPQVHNIFTFKSKHLSDKCNDYQSDGINGDKEDPFIFISSQRTPRRVRYRKDGVKIIGKTRTLCPDKKAFKQKEAGSNTIPRLIADEAQNVNVDIVENCPVNINDSFDQMVQDYKSCGNAQKQDAEISEAVDESDDCLNYLFKSLQGNSPSHIIDNNNTPCKEEKDKTKTNSKLRKKRLMNRSDNIALSKNKSLENVMMKEMEQSFSEINKHKLREENKLPLKVTTINHRGNDHSSTENTCVAGVTPKTDHAQVGINSKCDSFVENKVETLAKPEGKNVFSNDLNKRSHNNNSIGSCSTGIELVTLNKYSKLHNVNKSHLYQKSILGRTPLLTNSCDGTEMLPKASPNTLNSYSSKPENSKQDQILSETSGTKCDILPTNHSVIELRESPAKKQKLDIFDKITQHIQSKLLKNQKLVLKREVSDAKNNSNKEITLETPIVGSGDPVELKLKSNITDTLESMPNKTLECKNNCNDSKSVFSFNGLESDKFPKRVIIPTSDESDGQSSLSETHHASLTSIKENISTATQNKPLIKFWYLSSLRCDKDEKFLGCLSHLICNECSPLCQRNSHSFLCNPKETCDEECQATVAKLDVGTQSESHLTSKAKRTPIYVETGVQTCVPNKSCGNFDKLNPASPTCNKINPANLTCTTKKSPQENSVEITLLSKTKSTCFENTKPLTFASIEKQIQNDNMENTIVESTDIEFVPETEEDNHCADSEIFLESLVEVKSEDHPNDGKSLSEFSLLHLKPLVGLHQKQNGASTLLKDPFNSTQIINRSPVNMFAGENKSNIYVNFEDMPTQKQSTNTNNKHLSSLSDVSTVILNAGDVKKYIKEPEIYSKKNTNVLDSGFHSTHNRQMLGKSNCENKGISDYEVNNTAHSKANKAKVVRHLTFSQNVFPKLTDPSLSIFTEENMTLGKTKSKKVIKRARRISTSSDSGSEIRHEAPKRKLLKENIPVDNETLSPHNKNEHYFENDILSFDSDGMDEDEFMRRAVENCEISNCLSILPLDAPKNKSTNTGVSEDCNINISVTGGVTLSTQDTSKLQQLGRKNNQLLPNVSLTSSLQALLEPESRIDGESIQPHTMEFLEGSQKDDADVNDLDVCRNVEHDVHMNSDQDISSLGQESYLLNTQQQHDMEVKNKILKATIKECEANLKARMNVEKCHIVADSNESEQELNVDSEESPTEDFIYPTPQNKSSNRDIKTRLNLDSRRKQCQTPSKQSSNMTSILDTLNPQQTADVPTSCWKRATTINYQPMAGNVKQSTNPLPVTICTPSIPTELCIACSGLTLLDKQKVVHFADFFKLSFSNSYESKITHLVVPKVSENLRTIKFLFGIAEKKWIVYLDWITDSIAANTLLPEEKYEAEGNDVGPRLSRQTNRPLFQQFEFYFDSLSTETIDKAQIENLVRTCGAMVVSHPNKFSFHSGKICMIVIETQDDNCTRAIELYNEFKVPSFYLEFIIESIAQFTIADCYDYITLPITKEDFKKFGYPF